MSLGCSSPNVTGTLSYHNVANCVLMNKTCELWEEGCGWYTCDKLTDEQRARQCRNTYPDVPGIAAYEDVTQYPCYHSFSGWVGSDTTKKTVCYDSVDRDANNCCITGNPRTLQGVQGDLSNLQPLSLSSCDPNLLPENYAKGMCNNVFMGECPFSRDDMTKRIANYNKTRSYRIGSTGTIKGYTDSTDKCGQWMDSLSRSNNKQTSDIINKIVSNHCNQNALASETGETNTNRGTCREWCRQNPGQCDDAAKEYCHTHIESTCGTANKSLSCVQYAIDPFCTCIYWSERGMKQPQCFSSECQGGRGIPGYKTTEMSTVGTSCGQYCQQQVQILGNNNTVGDVNQSCNIVQSILSETKQDPKPNPEPTPIEISHNVTSSSTGLWISVMSFIFFIIIVFIVVIINSGTGNKRMSIRNMYKR